MACISGENLNGFSGFFSSPNFPNNFPQYSRCVWNITVPSGYIIKLSFLYFRLGPYYGSRCPPGANVTVTNVASDDGYHLFMLCGQTLPYPVYSVGNSIQVIFTSLSSQYPGFNATYTAITYGLGTWYTLFMRHQWYTLFSRHQWLSSDLKTITNNNSPHKSFGNPRKSWILDSKSWILPFYERPRGSQSGRKRRDESLQVQAKEPLGTDSLFPKFKQMPATDWAQKMLCNI